ncbi:MAG: single-stranded DNA-binding protein [Verrucomicrobiae bacterium]|nr:single-stranded DNA-binding protein [Verrucomicrobiae bacterium]
MKAASQASQALIAAARELSAQAGRLEFADPVAHVYNPLTYAWQAHEEYLRRFGDGPKRVVFLGMNPGPFGMVQTGIPFGEVAAVRDWLRLSAPIEQPARSHPKRPIQGYGCPRSEVSGRRLWKLFADRFGTAENFFASHFVANYCPLAFLSVTGSNVTPDKLSKTERAALATVCDAHLRRVLEILQPEWLIGIGAFACKRGELVADPARVRVGQILHPSPASPKANRADWTKTAAAELAALGVW